MRKVDFPTAHQITYSLRRLSARARVRMIEKIHPDRPSQFKEGAGFLEGSPRGFPMENTIAQMKHVKNRLIGRRAIRPTVVVCFV